MKVPPLTTDQAEAVARWASPETPGAPLPPFFAGMTPRMDAIAALVAWALRAAPVVAAAEAMTDGAYTPDLSVCDCLICKTEAAVRAYHDGEAPEVAS